MSKFNGKRQFGCRGFRLSGSHISIGTVRRRRSVVFERSRYDEEQIENNPFHDSRKSRRDIQLIVGENCHARLFKELARIVEHLKLKMADYKLCFAKLISYA